MIWFRLLKGGSHAELQSAASREYRRKIRWEKAEFAARRLEVHIIVKSTFSIGKSSVAVSPRYIDLNLVAHQLNTVQWTVFVRHRLEQVMNVRGWPHGDKRYTVIRLV